MTIKEEIELKFAESQKVKHWFWFSKKQQSNRRGSIPPARFDNFVTIDGIAHKYTETTTTDKPSGAHSDYELVGTATLADTFTRPVVK